MGGFVTIKRPNAEQLSYFRLLMMFEGPLVIILIHCKFEHFNQNCKIAKYQLILLKICLFLKDEGGKLLV